MIGRHISSTFYVEYSNTGTAAMPAPVILLESSVADDLPLFTLNKSLVVSGFWTSAIPQGYSNTVEILASGKVPGVLEPGRIGHRAGLLRRHAAAVEPERDAVQFRYSHLHLDRHRRRSTGRCNRLQTGGLSQPPGPVYGTWRSW